MPANEGSASRDHKDRRLAALAMEARLLSRGLAPGEAKDKTDRLVVELQALSQDVWRLSHRLHPCVLERLGLAEALEANAAAIAERDGLRVQLAVRDAGDSLPPEIAFCLYRVAQEALHNAARHSGAETTRLTLIRDDGEIRLTVADSGTGFDPAEARGGAGLGLASMEERARLLGGCLEVRSTPGAGTEIEVVLPLE